MENPVDNHTVINSKKTSPTKTVENTQVIRTNLSSFKQFHGKKRYKLIKFAGYKDFVDKQT